ncbi:MAG: hypothetical protein PHH04_03725 [Thomasclavelia sp.]|jgi:hypothetical protein|nr:hypothetical protein [Thomasclavelia sp.]
MKNTKKILMPILLLSLLLVTGCSKNWSEEKRIYDKIVNYGFKWTQTLHFSIDGTREFDFSAKHGTNEENFQCYVDEDGKATLILYNTNKDYGKYDFFCAPYDPSNEYGDNKDKMVKAQKDFNKFLKKAKIKKSEFHKFMDYVWYLHEEKGKFPDKKR